MTQVKDLARQAGNSSFWGLIISERWRSRWFFSIITASFNTREWIEHAGSFGWTGWIFSLL